MQKKRKIIANSFIVALLLCGALWIASLFIHIGGQYTNNAQVYRHIVPVSCRIQGFVKKVYFEEFQQVHKGDTLLVIEDTEFRLRQAQAQADFQNASAALAAAGTSISTTRNNLSVSDAALEEVRIQCQHAQTEYNRYQNLFDKGAVTRQQFEGVKTQYDALVAKLETMTRQKQTTRLVQQEQTQRLDQNAAGIDVCRAALELAELNLSYTVILAPCDGFTSRKTIQEGQLMNPGQEVVSIVESQNCWVIANFRETQMKTIEEGSKVEMKVDAFPAQKWEGTVASVSKATGERYSYAAPDNAVGNFVKVEQRIPVKILFTPAQQEAALKQLASGMNVECKVLK